MRYSLLVCFGLITLTVIVYAQQQVVVPATQDNTLYETVSGDISNGSGDYLFTGRVSSTGAGAKRRGLVRFDLTGKIPPGSSIVSATLSMNMSKANSGANTVSLHNVTSSWGEGTSNANSQEGKGASATTGDATWIHRSFNTVLWTSPGGDFTPTASASTTVDNTGKYQWGSTNQMVADVTSWYQNPSTNFGWIIVGDESAEGTSKRFDSRENPTSANRPGLTVSYAIINSIRETGSVIHDFSLGQNYPNPFNPSTTITYSLPTSEKVDLSIFDVLGNRIDQLIDVVQPAGQYAVEWNARAVPSGIYFYRLHAGTNTATKKLMLLK